MALVGYLVVATIVLFAAIVLYALYQRREVKAGLKIPFATFFFEAKDREHNPQTAKKQIKGG